MNSIDPQQRPDGDVLDLFRRGSELLEQGDYSAALISLAKAAELEPDKSSIREALGRAYFSAHRYSDAAVEFAAVVERYPVNDYAHFCLGRSLSLSGRADRARRHLALAANLRPDREDYRTYRDRLVTELERGGQRSNGISRAQT